MMNTSEASRELTGNENMQAKEKDGFNIENFWFELWLSTFR